ncbi:hypothetical protein BDR06DRAFT_953093 [Suillus hirtellus]|nr:hypothetical protein BDR06DRAFT_953093 [Suillus hirtellus]
MTMIYHQFKMIVPEAMTTRERYRSLSISLFILLSTVEGSVEHVYRHDVESLVWVSVRVCFRYEDGKSRKKNKPLCEWLDQNRRA